VTKFGKNVFVKSVLAEDMSVTGDEIHSGVLDWCRNVLYEKRLVLIGGVLAEPLRESFPLYLFGAGHVAQFVSKIAKIADFNITVIDDRDEFANRERFPDARAIVVEKVRDAFKGLHFTGREYVVAVTRSHETDAEVLEEAMNKPMKYAGMIGSKSKVKVILDRLRQKGVSEAVIRQVHAPIGIPIHAETPQEIAISIVAELITIRNSPAISQEKKTMTAR
jgi:xanthine dehydrogenase accessory factor